MFKKILILFFLFSIILPNESVAQDIRILLKEAQQFEAKFNDRESLNKYLEVLRHKPNHFTALCKASELYALLGRRQSTKEKQAEYYKMAKDYAQHAYKINPKHAEANFVMAFALGRTALISSGEQKVKAVKDVLTYAEKSVQLDPLHYKAYHILGKWHYEVSDLNTLERWLLRMAYGSLPPSSIEIAIRNFEKSKQLNSGFLINYLALAKAYNRKSEKKKAIELLKIMMKLPKSSSNDPAIKVEGEKLLQELS
jgi:tetratricopeptide (TPR) repeat protein